MEKQNVLKITAIFNKNSRIKELTAQVYHTDFINMKHNEALIIENYLALQYKPHDEEAHEQDSDDKEIYQIQ